MITPHSQHSYQHTCRKFSHKEIKPLLTSYPVYLRILCPRESEKAQLQTLGRAPGFRVRARMRGAGTEGDAGLQRRARVSRGRSEDRTHNCREAAPGCRTGMGTPHPVNFRRLQRKQELANQKPAGPGRCCEASLGWLAENLGARRSCPRTGWPTAARRSSYCQVKASPPPAPPPVAESVATCGESSSAPYLG